jgi:hypothetical protein
MMPTHTSIKEFDDIKGLDLRSSELKRDPMSATITKNCMLRQTSALNKRPGYTRKAVSKGGYGTAVYHNVSLSTGIITEEIVSVGNTLSRLDSGSITISYSGSSVATYYINTDGSQIQFYIYLDGVVSNAIALGTGSEGTPITITQLVASINAISGFTATGSSSAPAAFLDVAYSVTIPSTPLTIYYKYWTDITLPTGYVNPITNSQSLPFYNYFTTNSSIDLENSSIVEVNDVMYIATGFDELHKYDGTRLYRAGMPNGITPTTALDGAGVLDAGTYYYKITYEYTDAKGNLVEGVISGPSAALTVAASKSINITYKNLRHSYTTPFTNENNYKGFDTNSSNLKINIWRTQHNQSDTSTYYLVTSIANDKTSDTSLYRDNIPDSSVGAEYIPPVKVGGLPPKCKYLDVWRNMLIMSGCPTAVNTTYYADIEAGNEVFPSANSFDVDSKVTGLRSLDNVLGIFRERSIDGVTGDLSTDNFQVDHLSRDGIGCAANATIHEINGHLYFLSSRGVYRVAPSSGLEHIGLPISPKFQLGNPYSFKQATAMNWNDKFLYAIHMPVCPVNASYSTNTSSETFVFDYQRGAWFAWTNFNIMGGYAQLTDGSIHIVDRKVSEIAIHRVKNSLTPYDFSDHTDAISMEYGTHWETMGEPSLYKKFLRTKVHSYDISINDFENDTFNLNLLTQHDYLDDDVTDLTLNFSGGADGWGLGPWGNFPWGETRLSQIRTKIASKKSKSMRILFKNDTLHENILVSGWEIEAAVPYNLDPIAK